MLLSPNNLLKPSDGGPVAVPSQDMVLGIYYLTQERPGAEGEGMIFKSVNEAILAYENKAVTLSFPGKGPYDQDDGRRDSEIRNRGIHGGPFPVQRDHSQDLGFVDRSIPGNEFLLEIDFHVGKKGLKQILEKVIDVHGSIKTAETLDAIKAMGIQVFHQGGHDRFHFGYDRAGHEEAADRRRAGDSRPDREEFTAAV